MTLLFLFFDIDTQLNERLSSIEGQLNERSSKIEELIVSLKRRYYNDFSDCHRELKADCLQELADGGDLHLDIMVVAARFSWSDVLRDALPDWSRKYPNNNISVDIALVTEDTLKSWKAGGDWLLYLMTALAGIDNLKPSRNLSINVFRYDLIPQRQGILINSKILYIGRTEWDFSYGEPEIKVGQKPYARFTLNDETDMDQRISVFTGWMQRVRMRDAELKLESPGLR